MNELIFGKDTTERVVSVEPLPDGDCDVYVQNEEGKIKILRFPYAYWIIYKEQHSPKMERLSGDQHYKWFIDYSVKAKYENILAESRKRRYDFFTCRDVKEGFMLRSGVTYYKGLKVKDVSVLSFDLEHTFGIGDTLNRNGKLLLISNTFRDSKGKIVKKLFSYDEFSSEAEMIRSWCEFVKLMDPSIVIGHNIFGHDFKVLQFASNRAKVELRLGRNGSSLKFDHRKSFKRKDGSQAYEYHNVNCYGREIVDTFFLALTFDTARNYESYALKQIIKQEGLEKPGRVFVDAAEIIKRYQEPEFWRQTKEYAKDDADDALALFDLMIAPFFYATQSIPRSLQHVINSATGGQINSIMVRGYLQQNHSIARASEAEEFSGAISFGVPGLHRNVLRFDVASLYPSIIRQFKISPKGKDPQGLFLKMVNYFTDERLKNKQIAKETGDRYFKDLEQSQKIMINSMYGFLGAGKLNYNAPAGASEVTERGRQILTDAIEFLTGKDFSFFKQYMTKSEDSEGQDDAA